SSHVTLRIPLLTSTLLSLLKSTILLQCVARNRSFVHRLWTLQRKALRAWMKFRLKFRLVVTFLFLFGLSVLIIYTFPAFQSKQSKVKARGRHNKKPSKLVEKWTLRPYLPVSSHRQNSRIWKNPEIKDSAKHLLMVNNYHVPFSSRKTAKETLSTKKAPKSKAINKKQTQKNTNMHKDKGFAVKQGRSGKLVANTAKHLQESRNDPAFLQSVSIQSTKSKANALRHKCAPDGDKVKRFERQLSNAQQVVKPKQTPGDEGTHKRQTRSTVKKKSQSDERILAETAINDWCNAVSGYDFIGSLNQTKAESLPWLTEDDVTKMTLLFKGMVLSKARLPGHGQVLQVGLSDRFEGGDNPIKHCRTGVCALIKRPGDWFEVFAFHLDRVLGLNRSLPAVMRRFHSQILPYKYTTGDSRPVVWWDPSIQHLSDVENDQNSFSLSWMQYQALLKSQCGVRVPLNFKACVGVHHSEWGKLALFDFLLQVNDRLDRSCCGFRPDPTDVCVENLLHLKCGNPKELHLVRKTEPSKLVFIDNAGRPHQPLDNLNFRLVEGIQKFPEQAISVLKSGCLKKMLLHSLSVDREFWVSRGEAPGLTSLIQQIEQRARALLQHIQERTL
ncbi:hypothetical protein DNTS_018858, partial [Danionella cerebrum]